MGIGELGIGELVRVYPAIAIRPAHADALFGDLVAAMLDDFDVLAIDETEAGTLRAFLGDKGGRSAAIAALRDRFPDATIEALDVPDENWAERSQDGLRAIRAGALTIAPPWDAPGGASRQTIVILPSMGFGTGHHATTRLCLIALQASDVAGKAVIDVGTGSGVLALAAARLGASRVLGIDNDQDAIDNAIENRDLNALEAHVELRCADLEAAAGEGPYDIVVANLTGAVLIRLARELSALAAEGGRLILSGLREEEEADVLAAFGRQAIDRRAEDGWVCVAIRTGP